MTGIKSAGTVWINGTVRPLTFYHGDDGTPAWFIGLIIVSATSPSLIRNLLAVLYPSSTLFNNTCFW